MNNANTDEIDLLESAILVALASKKCDNKIASMSVYDMEKLFEADENTKVSTRTIHKKCVRLESMGLIAQGLIDKRKKRFYITNDGKMALGNKLKND